MELPDRLRAHLSPRYAVEGEIGRGGSATVFRARDTARDIPVAIKVLAPDVRSHVRPERFLREISIAGTLDHPNILPLLDSGDADGILYYVMPLAEGPSLRQRIDEEGALPVDEAVAIVGDVASGLAYAHEHGVVHRDVKPGNILEWNGRVVIADFGVARAVEHAVDGYRTSTGLVPGTPAYMSPEQAGGEGVDARSDIYALGCALYEALVGEPPFMGRTAQAVVARHLAERPPTLSVVRPGVPAGIAEVVERCLAKVPADRYQDMHALGRALAKGLTTSPHRGRPRWRWGAVGASAVALAAMTVWRLGLVGGGAPGIDDRQVVVFPLVVPGESPEGADDGWDVALAVGTALEHTDPLRWIDGWLWLDPDERQSPRLLSSQDASNIARSQGAAHYLTGVIRRSADSAWVTLHLTDTRSGRVVARETAAGVVSRPLYQVALEALPPLLSSLLEPGREVDLTPLTRRDPAAVALTIQGDRAYRHSDFAAAYDFYERATRRDSLLAIAAARGAAAGIWEEEDEDALALASLAVRHDSLLPPRYRYFVQGVEGYLEGQADTAVARLHRAMDDDPGWSEAGAVLGEVYYHLFPSGADPVAEARRTFEAVAHADTGFTPPLSHLAAMDLRRGDLSSARARIGRLTAALGAEAPRVQALRLMAGCVAGARGDGDWEAARWRQYADSAPGIVMDAAQGLAVAGAWPDCAMDGFVALRGATSAFDWVSGLGQASILLARGRLDRAAALLDSLIPTHRGGAYGLYLLGAVLSPRFDSLAGGLAAQARASDYRRYSPSNLWLLGIRSTVQGDSAEVEALAARLDAVAAQVDSLRSLPDSIRPSPSSGGALPQVRQVRTLASALHADGMLAAGRNQDALEAYAALRPSAPLHAYYWALEEPLAPERILQARALLEAGDFEGALRVASLFDHPSPIVYVAYLAPSLAIRVRAAEALGRRELADHYRNRLIRLGWSDGEVPLAPAGPLLSPTSTKEAS